MSINYVFNWWIFCSFHADEALAVFLLKQLDIYSGAQVLRSRNADAWASSDIVVDVGGIYDPSKNLFDHHQRDFQDTFSPLFFTKLSSAGLIYKHYGSQVISSLYASLKGTYPEAPQLTETLIEKLYVKIY